MTRVLTHVRWVEAYCTVRAWEMKFKSRLCLHFAFSFKAIHHIVHHRIQEVQIGRQAAPPKWSNLCGALVRTIMTGLLKVFVRWVANLPLLCFNRFSGKVGSFCQGCSINQLVACTRLEETFVIHYNGFYQWINNWFSNWWLKNTWEFKYSTEWYSWHFHGLCNETHWENMASA